MVRECLPNEGNEARFWQNRPSFEKRRAISGKGSFVFFVCIAGQALTSQSHRGIPRISSFRTTISSFRRGSKGCAGWVALEGDGHAHILMGPCSARRAPWGKLQRVSTTHILQEYVPFSRFFHACACARFLRTLMGAHQLARPCITPRVYVRASQKRGNKK